MWVIVEKIVYLIGSGCYLVCCIVVIIFINKLVKEMCECVVKCLCEQDVDEVIICIFYVLGLKFLQIEYVVVGLKCGFLIFDVDDVVVQIKDLMYGVKFDDIEDMKNLVLCVKNVGLLFEQVMVVVCSNCEKEVVSVYECYQLWLNVFNVVDFDDLICLFVQILEENFEIVLVWCECIGYLLVDECQDINDVQYCLFKQLVGEKGNFICVGDDDQLIYVWCGVNFENLQQMGCDYFMLEIIKLEQNYCCFNCVLCVVNVLIVNNLYEYLKKLWSDQVDGECIWVWECCNSEYEVEKVVVEIVFVVQLCNVLWSDFCILFRGNFQLWLLEKVMQLLCIFYYLIGGIMFLECQEVKDMLVWLCLLVNLDDDIVFMWVVQLFKCDVGVGMLVRLVELVQEKDMLMVYVVEIIGVLQQLLLCVVNSLVWFIDILCDLCVQMCQVMFGDMICKVVKELGLLSELCQQVKEEVSYQCWVNNIEELVQWFEGGLCGVIVVDLVGQLVLFLCSDKDEGGNQVCMMILYVFKGLEFLYVFIVGCEDGVLLYQVSLDEGNLQEEWCLLYVGIICVKIQLWMSYSKFMCKFGEYVWLKLSWFFEEILVEEIQCDGVDLVVDVVWKKECVMVGLVVIEVLFD